MKLNDVTKEVLNNFSEVNSNLVVTDEPFIRSVANAKNLMATATITDSFPYKFGIYDLGEFLSAMNMFDDPDLEFDDNQKFVKIMGDGTSLKYHFSDTTNLVTADKDVIMPDTDISFTLTNKQLHLIRKASSTLKAPHFQIVPEKNGGGLVGVVKDIKNPSSNEFALNLGGSINTSDAVDFLFDISNFKFIPSDTYKFEISGKQISSIETPTVKYWVALMKPARS